MQISGMDKVIIKNMYIVLLKQVFVHRCSQWHYTMVKNRNHPSIDEWMNKM